MKNDILDELERLHARAPLLGLSDRAVRKARCEVRIKPLFAWYDLWIGAYWDRAGRKLYVLPLPCVGVVIELGRERLGAK